MVPEEYLSIKQLCERIPYRPQSIRNMMTQGIFREGEHYFKPTARKVIFKWSAIQRWIEGERAKGAIPLARGG